MKWICCCFVSQRHEHKVEILFTSYTACFVLFNVVDAPPRYRMLVTVQSYFHKYRTKYWVVSHM